MKKNITSFVNIRIIIFIIASLCIAFYTLIIISGYSGIEETEQTTKSKQDRGHYIFYHLLKRLDYRILFWDTFSIFRRDTVLFYFHYKNNQHEDFQKIKDWVKQGNVLFLVGLYSDTDPFFNNKKINAVPATLNVHPSLIQGIDEFVAS